MKKHFYACAFLFYNALAFSQQTGIGTNTPHVNLEVKSTANNAVADGIMAPQLTRAQLTSKGDTLYTTEHTGTLIYITDVSGGDNLSQRININSIGYYYFDGATWLNLTGASQNSGSSIVKQKLTVASPNVVLTTASGDYSFRFSSTNGGPGTAWQIRNNRSEFRILSAFGIESYVPTSTSPTGYGVQFQTFTANSDTWMNIPVLVSVGTLELNTIRLYDMTTGTIYRFEGMLLNISGIKESMIIEEY
jgi:hypothetical protein